MTQSTLDFQRRQPEPVSTDLERAFLLTLRQQAGVGQKWTTGRVLCHLLGLPDHENTRRRFRSIAEANRARIATGDEGYALLSELTVSEAAHSWRRLMSQGRRMVAAAIKARNAYYSQERQEQPRHE